MEYNPQEQAHDGLDIAMNQDGSFTVDAPPPHVDDVPPPDEPPLFTSDDNNDAKPARFLPFGMKKNGKHIVLPTEKDAHIICDYFEIIAQTQDETGRNHGRLLRIMDKSGRTHEIAIPMKDVDGTDIIKMLRDYGVMVSYVFPSAARYVCEYIQSMNVDKIATCVTQGGWHDDVYVSPHGTFPASSNMVLQVRQQDYKGIESRGTLQDWQQYVALPCKGNHRVIFGIMSALAAPILPLVSDEGGGVHFHGKSSMGKTTLLLVGCSVIGSPAIKKQWRTTDNGAEGLCALHNHMVLILDEIGQVDDRKLADMIYMIANGQAKTRSNSNVMLRDAARWQLLFISSGELGISDKICESGKTVRAGVTNRAIDVPSDAGEGHGCFDVLNGASDGAALSNQLKEASARYYGTAFPAFIDYLVRIKPDIAERYEQYKKAFIANHVEADADGQVRRVAERVALIGFAGELAIEAGILPYEAGSATESARVCFDAWVEQRGGQGAYEKKQAIEQVRHFLELHQSSRFQSVMDDGEAENSGTTYNLAGYIKEIDGERCFLIQPEVFKSDVCKGLEHGFVCQVLHDDGHLLREGRNYAKLHRVNGLAEHKRFYTIKYSLLDGGES